jgi:hypothetical protein
VALNLGTGEEDTAFRLRGALHCSTYRSTELRELDETEIIGDRLSRPQLLKQTPFYLYRTQEVAHHVLGRVVLAETLAEAAACSQCREQNRS